MREVYVFDFEIEEFLEMLKRIIEAAQERLDYKFSKEQLEKCMAYTIRKARLNGKKNDYVPLLFEDEINFIPRYDKEEVA